MQCALAGVADGDRLLSRATVDLAEVRRTADGELSARRISRHRHPLRTCRVVAYEPMTSNRRYPSGRLARDRLPGAPTLCRRAVRSRRRRRSPWPSSRTGRRWPGRRGAHGCGPRPVAPRGGHRLSSGIASRLGQRNPAVTRRPRWADPSLSGAQYCATGWRGESAALGHPAIGAVRVPTIRRAEVTSSQGRARPRVTDCRPPAVVVVQQQRGSCSVGFADTASSGAPD